MKTQTAWTARNRIVEGWSEAEFQSEIIGLARVLGTILTIRGVHLLVFLIWFSCIPGAGKLSTGS